MPVPDLLVDGIAHGNGCFKSARHDAGYHPIELAHLIAYPACEIDANL
jgi:hypothetical protein